MLWEVFHNEKVKEVNICPSPFYSLIIHSNGDVGVCCSDWERFEILGNVKYENFVNIFMGGHRKFLINMLKHGRRDCSIACRKCEYPNYTNIDNIDLYAEQILNKINKKYPD